MKRYALALSGYSGEKGFQCHLCALETPLTLENMCKCKANTSMNSCLY